MDQFSDPGDPLSIVDQTIEGITIDDAGNLYLLSEDGGGDFDDPQLWVFPASAAADQAPTALTLDHAPTSIVGNSNTTERVRVADMLLTDDGLGSNTLSLSRAHAAEFEIDNTDLYLRACTPIDDDTRSSDTFTVNVEDPSVGGCVDASTDFTPAVANVVNEGGGPAGLYIFEADPWSSGNSPVGADWFEVRARFQTSSRQFRLVRHRHYRLEDG